jgi:hypothetical protein
MPHSYYSVWIHAVFATKDRKPLIKPEIENHLYDCLPVFRDFQSFPIKSSETQCRLNLVFYFG